MTTEPWFPIRTKRLLLRDFRPTDLDDVHAYGSDPEVARFMTWGPNTPEETRQFFDRVVEAQTVLIRLDFGFAIELAAQRRVIGSIGLHIADPAHRTVELGYCLHHDFWRQGLVSEAADALVDVGFRTLGLHRVIATCDTRNTGSFGVMEKLAMRREGCLRLDRQVKGEWRDTYMYAVLHDEWIARGPA